MVLDELPQDMGHHPLERARRVHQSKRHNKPFIMAVNLREKTGPSQRVEAFLNYGKGVLVFLSDSVNLCSITLSRDETASIGPKSTVYLSVKSLKRLARGSSEPNANGSSTGTSSQGPTTPLDSVNASSFSYAPDHKLLLLRKGGMNTSCLKDITNRSLQHPSVALPICGDNISRNPITTQNDVKLVGEKDIGILRLDEKEEDTYDKPAPVSRRTLAKQPSTM
ncbi:hypothetical protein PGT21_017951 [Puccinia graminis f. sp. tritici]|uniref:Uncharacterized protein n=1 Tax=Puccinia graminis f. sp. tritici TaxID=56615 RepID=A0A5B0N212_PUCGR|nr:hypothetical protein PGT21_017951 [Puccinia graminis f. sp. tritici]